MTLPESSAPESQETWSACPRDEVARVVAQARRKRRQIVFSQIVVPVAAILFVVVSGWYYLGSSSGGPGGISCAKVHAALPALKNQSLEKSLQAKVEAHLRDCPHCRDAYEKLQKEVGRKSPPSRITRLDPALPRIVAQLE